MEVVEMKDKIERKFKDKSIDRGWGREQATAAKKPPGLLLKYGSSQSITEPTAAGGQSKYTNYIGHRRSVKIGLT
jgi:hypothetical protein